MKNLVLFRLTYKIAQMTETCKYKRNWLRLRGVKVTSTKAEHGLYFKDGRETFNFLEKETGIIKSEFCKD